VTDSAQKTATVRLTRRFAVSPETLFDAWLDSKVAGRFLFATPTGTMVKAETDPRVGGAFVFVDRRPDMGDVEHTGTYLEIDRPRRLVFEFCVPKYERQLTRVAIDIAPDGDGSILTLTHDGVFEAYAKQTEHGWGLILDALGKAL
jgi:uncharacterized protein YndB with AHSA1/START domain